MKPDMNKRDQVKALIEKGGMTKAAIAAELQMSPASVSTQMTYLRWMDHYIYTDPETKVLSFISQEDFEKYEAEKQARSANRSTAAARTPDERAVAVSKAIANQKSMLAKWQEKVKQAEEILKEHADNADAALNLKEANAQVALHEVKIARNEALAKDLPDAETAKANIAKAAAEQVTEAITESTDIVVESEGSDSDEDGDLI